MTVTSRSSRLFLALALVAGTALATTASVLAVITGLNGSVIDRVQVVRSTDPSITNSQAWVNIPGANTVIAIPVGTRAAILARYSAESACYGGPAAPHWCSVRIMVGPLNGPFTEMHPQSGTDFAFDSTNVGRESAASWASHSMDRSTVYLPAGQYRVFAQYRTSAPTVRFRVDDWSLTVEKLRP